MSNNVTLIIATIASGGFALLGAGLNSRTGIWRDRERYRAETAVELAQVERLIWQDDWTELNIELRRQEARLAMAGVPNDLVGAFREMSIECWRDRKEDVELGLPDVGIRVALLDVLRSVHGAIGAYLLRDNKRTRERLRRQAVEESRRVLNERGQIRLR